jgi:hypothetical protein
MTDALDKFNVASEVMRRIAHLDGTLSGKVTNLYLQNIATGGKSADMAELACLLTEVTEAARRYNSEGRLTDTVYKSILRDAAAIKGDCNSKVDTVNNEGTEATWRCRECNSKTSVDAERSFLVCGTCHSVTPIEGVAYSHSQFYSQEGQKARAGVFNPERHLMNWMVRLQAREPETELNRSPNDPDDTSGNETVEKIKRLMAEKGVQKKSVTVKMMREYLAKVERTGLNPHAPLLIKLVTGEGPPILKDSTRAHIEACFLEVLGLIGEVARSGQNCSATATRSNRKNYPYYIYKIVAQKVTDLEELRLLNYIYLQGNDTLVRNDEQWREICQLSEGKYTYQPTTLNEYDKLVVTLGKQTSKHADSKRMF